MGWVLLGLLAACGLGFLFGRNAYIGMQSGTVWARGTPYHRGEEPILFWIALSFSALFAVVCFVMAATTVYLLVTLRP